MRRLLAIFAVLLLLAAASAPHAHGSELGAHACAACVARGVDEAVSPALPGAPLPAPGEVVPLQPSSVPSSGAPLGAIPGQSPPAGA